MCFVTHSRLGIYPNVTVVILPLLANKKSVKQKRDSEENLKQILNSMLKRYTKIIDLVLNLIFINKERLTMPQQKTESFFC